MQSKKPSLPKLKPNRSEGELIKNSKHLKRTSILLHRMQKGGNNLPNIESLKPKVEKSIADKKKMVGLSKLIKFDPHLMARKTAIDQNEKPLPNSFGVKNLKLMVPKKSKGKSNDDKSESSQSLNSDSESN